MGNFDTIEELEQIKDLYVLNEAIKTRNEVYRLGQTLHDFVLYIGGIQFLISKTGGLLIIQGKNPCHYVYEPLVKSLEKMTCYSQNKSSYSFVPVEIQDADMKCDYCQKKWTLENFLNIVSDEQSHHYHRECERLVTKIKHTGNIKKIVEESGLGFNSMDYTDHYPFRVITQYGLLSVELTNGYTIIGWEGMYKAKEISLILEKEHTIKNENYIYASGEDEILEYLTKMHNFYKHK